MLKNEITLENKELLNQYFKGYPHDSSSFNFTNLFMWKHLNQFKYEIINDFLCISGSYYGEPFLFPPLPKKQYTIDQLSDTLDLLIERFEKTGYPFKIKVVPYYLLEPFKKAKPNRFRFSHDRDNDDYVYLAQDLILLQGRKLHAKKNHWNYFMNHIPHEYVPLTKDLVTDCLALNRQLKKGKYTAIQSTLIDYEETAIEKAFASMDQLDYKGGAILIHGKVEAFTFGEKLNHHTMVIHIEKANTEFRGLYQAINQKFCEQECSTIKYVNREEDMGFDYLRKAKKSYRPIKMIEKYDITML